MMSKGLKSLYVGVVLAAASAGASAGLHQICYEGQAEDRNGTRYYKVVVGCSNEAGGSCEISGRPVSGGFWGRDPLALNAAYVQATGTFEHWQWSGAQFATLGFDIAFKDAVGNLVDTRPCEVTVGRNHAYGYVLSHPAVLTGFSTDASGLVTTGVWRNRSAYLGAMAQVMLPSGFAAVGGGVQTAESAFIAYSRRTANRVGWQAASYTDDVGTPLETPRSTLAYAIGMQIRGLHLHDQLDPYQKDSLGNPLVVPGLLSLIESHTGNSPSTPQVYPAATGTPPVIFGSVGLGGEFQAAADSSNSVFLRGQYGITTAPQLGRPLLNCVLLGGKCTLGQPVAMAWRAESTDDLGRHPGRVSATFLALPLMLDIGGQAWEVRGGVVRASVAAADAPAGTVTGLRGQYALTGIGADLQWRQFQPVPPPDVVSNRLASLQPQAELGGGSVTTRHGSIASQATLDVYGLGIKLVKPGTEPDVVERPIISIKERFWLPLLCELFEGMSGWSGCQVQKAVRLDTLCASFPDLPEHGVCVKR